MIEISRKSNAGETMSKYRMESGDIVHTKKAKQSWKETTDWNGSTDTLYKCDADHGEYLFPAKANDWTVEQTIEDYEGMNLDLLAGLPEYDPDFDEDDLFGDG